MATFNSNNVEKLNEMLETQVFNWMQTQEKSMVEQGINDKNTSCPSTGIIGIAAEVEGIDPSELLAHMIQDMFHGEYSIKAYKPQFIEKTGNFVYPVKIHISDNKVINHNGTTYIYYKNARELATVGSAIKICSIDKEQVEKAMKYIDFLKVDAICCTYNFLTEKVADYIAAM